MSRILDERDKQQLENRISTTVAYINKDIENLEADLLAKNTEIVNTLNAHKNNTYNPHKVTYTQVGADPAGSAAKALSDAKTYTDTKLSDLVDSAPETLDTLNELAAALNDNSNFAATMTTELGKKTNNTDFAAHTSNVSNPHKVTASQIGLGNVDNTSDADKPVSAAQNTAISNAKLELQNKINIHLSDLDNPHDVNAYQVGLGNVDNTSDAAKPVSTAQATAIADAKKAGTDAQNSVDAHVNNKENPHNVTASQVGADTFGSAAKALSDAKNYTNNQLEFELETIRTLYSDRLDMLEARVESLPSIGDADEGKVLCVVNGAYKLVSIEDLLSNA